MFSSLYVLFFKNMLCLLGARIILRPDPYEFIQVMCSQDGRVSCQVVKVVHDDSNEQVEHKEGAEEDERHKVGVGQWGTTTLVRIQHFAW